MTIIGGEERLCLCCMEDHMVYEVIDHGMRCEYCYNTDSFLIDPDEYMHGIAYT